MSKLGRPKLDPSLRYNLSENIRELRKARGFSYETLRLALKQRGIAINPHTLRAWERSPNQNSASVPSLTHLITLSDLFGVHVDALLGLEAKRNHSVPYEIVRRPLDETEEKVIDLLQKVTNSVSNRTGDQPAVVGWGENRRICRYLLSSNLIYVSPANIQREEGLEEALRAAYDFLREVRVFKLPGEGVPGIRDFFFAAVTADYFEEVATECIRIGLAGGRTLTGMMHMTRQGSLNKLELFPILRVGGVFAASTFSSTAIVSSALFKHEDFGVSVPENMDKNGFFESYLKTADALFFSPGNNQDSSIMRILKSIGFKPKQLDVFVGDVLFNFLTAEGKSLDEIDFDKASEAEKAAIEEILGFLQKPEVQENIDIVRLDFVNFHAQQHGLRTIVLTCGIEKAQIIRAMLARPEPVCNVLVTDREVATALLDERNSVSG